MILLLLLSIFYTEIISIVLFFSTGFNPYILAICFSVSSSAFSAIRKWSNADRFSAPLLFSSGFVKAALNISTYFSLVPFFLLLWKDWGGFTIITTTVLLRFCFGFLYYRIATWVIAMPPYFFEHKVYK